MAPLIDFKSPPRGGPYCRIAELVNKKTIYHKFPLREYKDKNERSLDISIILMYENANETATILKELDSVLNIEPTLEELNAAMEMERPEFTKDTEWTFTADERNKVTLNEPILTGGSSSSGTTGKDIEASSTSMKARVGNIERSIR